MRDEPRLLASLHQRLSPSRLAHSLNVADSAAALARCHGVDELAAYFAGLAHDICKCDSVDNMTRILKNSGYTFLDCECGNAKLLHAPAGAEFLRLERLCNEADILNAMRYHTTGRAGMSLLEKVVFMADLISAERDYPDVDIVRKLAFADLDGALRYVLRYIISDLTGNGETIHPNSVECLEWLDSLP
ncbi:MAG: bis(5'-nucleosyl)-tetraphosphatase (symmetrical) YqeK [Oscillospiraceae bacterium]|jgi:nicotinate-nucleotide adenylyltransferase|nr:bis(5'-nucleosyl)-tetraphosphatase (symmetrical) YqeK [Oscillospiraceae bacterium]